MLDTGRMSLVGSEISAISRVFSSAVVRELASLGRSPLLARLARQSGLIGRLERRARVRDFFEVAFDILRRRDNRHEYIYKSVLAQRILLGTHSLRTASMLTEFRAGNCKADVVILNGTSVVYEIKSERDNLDRLRCQLAAYLTVFDRINVITGRNHLAALRASVPEQVGILALSSDLRVSTIRPATSNMKHIQPKVLFESLRSNEARKILERCGHVVEPSPNTRARSLLKEEFDRLAPEQVHQAFVEVLKITRRSPSLEEAVHSVPVSLQAMAVTIPLDARGRARFTGAMDLPFEDALAWA